jgi:DNA-binding response OmpR family regulator
LVREALEAHRVAGELLVIGDGDTAIRHIQEMDKQPEDCPDLLIIDLNLPKRSGREVLQAIRQSAKCRHATVVVLSSSDAQQDRAESIRLGASRYLRKPLRLDEFLSLGAVFKVLLEPPGDARS